MATREQLDKWRRGLQATFPLVGLIRRRGAIKNLETRREEPEVVPLLIEALGSPDAIVAGRANAALCSLSGGAAVDALCAAWARGRDDRLGAIIAERGYVASQPAALRALSGLKAGVVELLRGGDGEVTRAVVDALGDGDAVVAGNASSVLAGLSNPAAVDALCAIWADNRDESLGATIAERGYVAQNPLNVRILSALKSGKSVPTENGKVVEFLTTLLSDADETVCAGADRDLRACGAGAGQDALCEEAIKSPQGPAAKICVETGKRHGDHEKNCLFLFVTRQLDAYFQEDFEFQALRLEYDRAGEAVKGQVMDVVRSGDRRCAGFIVSGGRGGKVGAKSLAECTEQEIKVAMDSWVRHGQWERLFGACLELPLKYSWAAFGPLRKSSWSPPAPEYASLLKQVLADSDGQAPPETRQPNAESSLFDSWLAAGRSGELTGASEADLLKRVESGEPAGSVSAVAALAGKTRPGSAAADAVGKSPHWLVRLAEQATGLTLDLARDAAEDSNWWVKELATAAGVLEFWPARATPADLEKLTAAPREAWSGRLGAARKALRTILGHRVTTGTFEPMVVQAEEFAGEFVAAGEAEFVNDDPKT